MAKVIFVLTLQDNKVRKPGIKPGKTMARKKYSRKQKHKIFFE